MADTVDSHPAASTTDPLAPPLPPPNDDVTGDGGVLKTVLREGSGFERPTAGAEVRVHYTGRLDDGTVFDSSVDRGEPFVFKLGSQSVIRGWEEGVQTMRKGEKATFVLRQDYAYGTQGSPPKIPPNATLHFDIELLSWQADRELGKRKDGSCVKKTLKAGEGWEHPKPEALVTARLSGVLLNSGVEFLPRCEVTWTVGDGSQPKGVDKCVKDMKKGELAEVTLQPSVGFGEAGSPALGVPGGTAVRYTVELLDFVKVKESYEMNNDEKFEQTVARRQAGNELFRKQSYKRAIKTYESALACMQYDHTFSAAEKERARELKLPVHLNLAQAYLKSGKTKEAIEQANKALELDSRSVKGLLRRSHARRARGELGDARRDLVRALEIEPANTELQQELRRVDALQKQQDQKDKAIFSKMFS